MSDKWLPDDRIGGGVDGNGGASLLDNVLAAHIGKGLASQSEDILASQQCDAVFASGLGKVWLRLIKPIRKNKLFFFNQRPSLFDAINSMVDLHFQVPISKIKRLF